MTPRRSNHEGSIYQRKSDGLWLGVAHVGYDSSGKPLRKYVSSKKRPEVVKKLKELRRRIDDGQLLKTSDVTCRNSSSDGSTMSCATKSHPAPSATIRRLFAFMSCRSSGGRSSSN